MELYTLARLAAPLTAAGITALTLAGAVRRTEQEMITSLEKMTAQALLSADTDALDKLWLDEFTFTGPDGKLLTKAAYLSLLQGRELEYETLAPVGIAVRVYGETAIVSGSAIVKGRAGERNIASGVDSYLTVYVRRDGRWRQAATHSTRLSREDS